MLPLISGGGKEEVKCIRFGGEHGSQTVMVFQMAAAAKLASALSSPPVKSHYEAALTATVDLPGIDNLRELLHLDGMALPLPFQNMTSRADIQARLILVLGVRVDQSGTDFWLDVELQDGSKIALLLPALLLASLDEELN